MSHCHSQAVCFCGFSWIVLASEGIVFRRAVHMPGFILYRLGIISELWLGYVEE